MTRLRACILAALGSFASLGVTPLVAHITVDDLGAPRPAAPPRILHLGTLGGAATYPSDINNHNQVVGGANVPDDSSLFHAVLWDRGRIVDLGTLPGGLWSDAYDVNERGQIVGVAFDEVWNPHAVIWENGHIRDLGGPPGSRACVAGAINDRGEIVGQCSLDSHGVVIKWQADAPGVLQELPLPLNSAPIAISDHGVIAAVWFDPSGLQRAVRWRRGETSILDSPAGYAGTVARRINARSQIVGHAYSAPALPSDPPLYLATLWDGGQVLSLGTLPGEAESAAGGINNRGDVVGWSGPHPVLWRGGAARALPIPEGRASAHAVAINDRGVIAGTAVLPTGESSPVLWLPGGAGNDTPR
jgi:probable HAF family extracellular repeat protein